MAKKKTPIPEDVKKLLDEVIEENNSKDEDKDTTPVTENTDEVTTSNEIDLDLGDDEEEEMPEIEASLISGEGFKRGSIVAMPITDELRKDYIDYAMSVIVSRAIPDTKDGLKPSQRRVLVAMRDLTLWPTGATRKCAKIVGQTTGDYHPHGDQAVYGTLVKMGQDFSTRYMSVIKQGNFGSIDGDSPAHMRYTEAKLSKLALELVKDIDKGTVIFAPNYDGSKNEPLYLPAAYPNILCNGTEGIAVGMATKIPPHNMTEVIDAVLDMINRGNSWTGSTVYNELRKLQESTHRVPVLLNNEPHSFWENYLDIKDPLYKEKVVALSEYLKTKDENLLKVFGDNSELVSIILSSVKREKSANDAGETLENEVSLYPKFVSRMTALDLMEHVKGPDFPTYGHIYNQKDILSYYEKGTGRIKMRGVIDVEEDSKGHYTIVIKELPYQVNKAILVENIANLVHAEKITGIKTLRDESSKNDIRVILELKAGFTPQIIVGKLFKYTALQMNFNANMIALVDGEPKTLPLKRMLELYIEHRTTVYIRKLEYELAQNKYNGHILEGLLKALDFIEEVIKIIRASKNQDDAKVNLMERFEFTDVQAQAIMDMPLKKLAALERQKIMDEYDGIQEVIKHHELYLADQTKILELVAEDLKAVKEAHGDKRRTKVFKGDVDEPQDEDLIISEETFVTISKSGYIKRISPEEYRVQNRGGKGSIGAKLKENDYVQHTVLCNTHDALLVFMSDGKVFTLKTYEIPEFKRTSKGIPIVNLLAVSTGSEVRAILPLSKDNKEAKFIMLATAKGFVKKTALTEFDNIRKTGILAIALKEEDKLIAATLTTGKDQIMIISKLGKSIRFDETEVRETGRNTMGVTGITISKDDQVITSDVVTNKEQLLLTVSQKGFAKMAKIGNFKIQHRHGSGIFAARTNAKTGPLVIAVLMDKPADKETAEIMIVTKQGIVIRTTLKSIPILSNRQTFGVKVIKVSEGDEVVDIAV